MPDHENCRPGKRFRFKLSALPDGEKLVRAELRLYRTRRAANDGRRFELVLSRVEPSEEPGKPVELRRTTVDAKLLGWVVLNVTGPYEQRSVYTKRGQDLYLQAFDALSGE